MADLMAWPLNLVEYAYNAEDVQRWMAGKTSGIYGQEGNYQVVVKSGRTISVQAEGMVGGWLSNMGKYGVCFWNDLDIDLEVALGDGYNPRIDRVVVSWYIPQQSTKPTVEIRQGTPAASPVAPALVNNGEYSEICLAEIRVPAGMTEVTTGMIHDTRLDEELCGLVAMGIEKIPIDGLTAEYVAWLEEIQRTYYEWYAATKGDWDAWFAGTKEEWEAWFTASQEAFEAWFAQAKQAVIDFIDEKDLEFDQWTAGKDEEFDYWFESVKGKLDGDAGGNMANDIYNLEQTFAQYFDYLSTICDVEAVESQNGSGLSTMTITLTSGGETKATQVVVENEDGTVTETTTIMGIPGLDPVVKIWTEDEEAGTIKGVIQSV